MAFDGVTLRALALELDDKLTGGKIQKVAEPEKDELLVTIKHGGETYLLLISANASLPLMYLTDEKKKSPDSAPNFCMVLRKHMQSGTILKVEQIGMERVIRFSIEHSDEMRDLSTKYLYVEIMGKHSNIIFTKEDGTIIDSIKHVNAMMSSVREVLPGKEYFIPAQEGKENPLDFSAAAFLTKISEKNDTVMHCIVDSFTGLSPSLAIEMCFRAGIDSDANINSLTENEKATLSRVFEQIISEINAASFSPSVYFDQVKEKNKDFSVITLTHFSDYEEKTFDTVSEMLKEYYSKKNHQENQKQKAYDLKRTVETILDRNRHTLAIQEKQLKDTEKSDKYRVYGELLHTYGNTAEEGAKSVTVDNYYTGEKLTIPLDPSITPRENANKYFKKYEKMKRTKEQVTERIKETENAIKHLESIDNSLTIADTSEELDEIKKELADAGFTKYHAPKGKPKKMKKSEPLHFVTNDGFDIFVGKNNFQNDYLTFKFANGNDLWFHVKTIPGSHVILRTEGKEVPDADYVTAAEVAAYFSTGKDNEKQEVDYVIKKEVKKPNGSAPGFVVYYTNYSMVVHPTLDHVTEVKA
jgi:predicted ribosome quality control (RQC) complex YloA/Tae2 family protein